MTNTTTPVTVPASADGGHAQHAQRAALAVAMLGFTVVTLDAQLGDVA